MNFKKQLEMRVYMDFKSFQKSFKFEQVGWIYYCKFEISLPNPFYPNATQVIHDSRDKEIKFV